MFFNKETIKPRGDGYLIMLIWLFHIAHQHQHITCTPINMYNYDVPKIIKNLKNLLKYEQEKPVCDRLKVNALQKLPFCWSLTWGYCSVSPGTWLLHHTSGNILTTSTRRTTGHGWAGAPAPQTLRTGLADTTVKRTFKMVPVRHHLGKHRELPTPAQ